MNKDQGIRGVAFLVGAEFVYNAIAAINSSPQTTELNAKKRAPTLMKWVHMGLGQSAVFVIIAAAIDNRNRGPLLAGGFMAGGSMYWNYTYAKKCGLESMEPGTEDYGSSPARGRAHAGR